MADTVTIPDDAVRFLRALDPDAARFTFQTFDDDKARHDSSLARVIHGTLDHRVVKLTRLNERGAGVFITVNETDGKGRKAENIVRVRALFADLDGAPLEPVLQYEPKVHIIVESSPGRWHAYWLVVGATLEEFASLQLALAQRFGADTSVTNLDRVLRLPGFVHRKDEPFTSRIVSIYDHPAHQASEFERAEIADRTPNEELLAEDPLMVEAALKVIPNEDLKWPEWNNIIMAIWSAFGGSEQGRVAAHAWSRKSSKYSEAYTNERWNVIARHPPNRIGTGSLVFEADQVSQDWRNDYYDEAVEEIHRISASATFSHTAEPEADTPKPKPEKPKPEKPKQRPDPPPKQQSTPVDLWNKYEPPGLPRGLLPDIIERFAFINGDMMGADPAGLAMAALTVCGATITDDIKLQPKKHERWTESARIWTFIISDPSGMKSPILRYAEAPLARLDKGLFQSYLEAKAIYDALPADERKTTKPPDQVRLRLEDTTVEAAQDVLMASPHGVLLVQFELSGFIGSMDCYTPGRSSSGSKDRGFWLKTYDGVKNYSVNRVRRGAMIIENLSCRCSQPAMIRKIAANALDDGLLQRGFTIVIQPAVMGKDEPADPINDEYDALIEGLRALDKDKYVDTLLRFDDDAQQLRSELERKHLDLLKCEVVNRKLAEHFGKYNGMFARLCVIWHCIENVNKANLPTTITKDTAQRVARFLHEFLAQHARAFYIGTLGLADDHDRLAAVAGYILARGLKQITTREFKYKLADKHAAVFSLGRHRSVVGPAIRLSNSGIQKR